MKDVIDSFSGRYGFLSNFAPSPVYIMVGLKWERCVTVEHAYQASKTLVERHRLRIINAESPAEAKRIGRSVKVVSYWEDVKVVVMLELLRQKFSRSVMQKKLIMTGKAELVEGNHWHDNVWGVCICTQCLEATNNGELAENRLGKLLMRVRRDIRK